MYGFCNSCDQKRHLVWDKRAQEWVCKECLGEYEPLNIALDHDADGANRNQSSPGFTVNHSS